MNEDLERLIELAKRKHRKVEILSCWHRHDHGTCTCGADKHNAEVEEIAARMRVSSKVMLDYGSRTIEQLDSDGPAVCGTCQLMGPDTCPWPWPPDGMKVVACDARKEKT